MNKLLWDVNHREFSISDHYYFSKLQNYFNQWGIEWNERDEKLTSKFLSPFNILVLCYPEEPFSLQERKAIKKFLENGGKVIIAAYYRCSDKVTEICNTLTEEWGIKFRDDEVTDPEHCLENDPLLITTTKIPFPIEGVSSIFFPCSASLKIDGDAEALILGEESAKSDMGDGQVVLGAVKKVGKGKLIALGTCVFWDNFAIEKLDNLEFCKFLFTSL